MRQPDFDNADLSVSNPYVMGLEFANLNYFGQQ
jgi:hypothetical protein